MRIKKELTCWQGGKGSNRIPSAIYPLDSPAEPEKSLKINVDKKNPPNNHNFHQTKNRFNV